MRLHHRSRWRPRPTRSRSPRPRLDTAALARAGATRRRRACEDAGRCEGSYDEVFAEPGRPREHALALAAALAELGPEALVGRRPAARRDLHAAGDHVRRRRARTPTGPVRDRPFPLDLVPRIIPADEWRTIKRGLAQRIRALNAFVDDVYHAPRDRPRGHRAVGADRLALGASPAPRTAIRPPGGVYCHVSGCDLVRDADGSGRCSRTTSARRAASPTCSRTASR